MDKVKIRLLSVGFVAMFITTIGLTCFSLFKPVESATTPGTALPIEKGGTSAVTANEAAINLGLESASLSSSTTNFPSSSLVKGVSDRLSTVEGRVYITESGTTAGGVRYQKYSDGTWRGIASVTSNVTMAHISVLDGNVRLWRSSAPQIATPTPPSGCNNRLFIAVINGWGTVPSGVGSLSTTWVSAMDQNSVFISGMFTKADATSFTITNAVVTFTLSGTCA